MDTHCHIPSLCIRTGDRVRAHYGIRRGAIETLSQQHGIIGGSTSETRSNDVRGLGLGSLRLEIGPPFCQKGPWWLRAPKASPLSVPRRESHKRASLAAISLRRQCDCGIGGRLTAGDRLDRHHIQPRNSEVLPTIADNLHLARVIRKYVPWLSPSRHDATAGGIRVGERDFFRPPPEGNP